VDHPIEAARAPSQTVYYVLGGALHIKQSFISKLFKAYNKHLADLKINKLSKLSSKLEKLLACGCQLVFKCLVTFC